MTTDPSAEPIGALPANETEDSRAAIFWRFLKFGCLAWGGPAAQNSSCYCRRTLLVFRLWKSRPLPGWLKRDAIHRSRVNEGAPRKRWQLALERN